MNKSYVMRAVREQGYKTDWNSKVFDWTKKNVANDLSSKDMIHAMGYLMQRLGHINEESKENRDFDFDVYMNKQILKNSEYTWYLEHIIVDGDLLYKVNEELDEYFA